VPAMTEFHVLLLLGVITFSACTVVLAVLADS
jgi:hypothetical protein